MHGDDGVKPQNTFEKKIISERKIRQMGLTGLCRVCAGNHLADSSCSLMIPFLRESVYGHDD